MDDILSILEVLLNIFYLCHHLVSNLFFRPIRIELNFYFMNRAKISVNVNVAVYGTIALSVYKLDYTLICLEYNR